MRMKNYFIYFIFFFAFFSFFIVNAEGSSEVEEYIYFDLSAGNVTINSTTDNTTYTGYAYALDGTIVTITGNHSDDNRYYIFQTTSSYIANQVNLYENDPSSITSPVVTSLGYNVYFQEYTDLSSVTDSFINNTDINGVISEWKTKATEAGRVATANWVTIKGNATFDVVIDNLWSSYHKSRDTSRTTGGIAVVPQSSGCNAIIRLKGQNRFGNIFYAVKTNSNLKANLSFTSFDGDGSTNGDLIVGNLSVNGGANYYNSGIGGSDNNYEDTPGLVFDGGTIYVGTTSGDDCTAIGAGGNGESEITINGGIITAVSNSTGAAIGGGIGYTSQGGDTTITINDGIVYAYNFGYRKSTSEPFIPAVAIGGGSSKSNAGNAKTVITINGGNVYAESLGGAAIGGGSSHAKNGGPATISITGGNVEAISTSGIDNLGGNVNAGNGIGGGTSINADGGNATLNISGASTSIKTGSIGGGKGKTSVGSATVLIEDGLIQGQFVMASGTTQESSFTMNGGVIDNGNVDSIYTFIEDNGGAVHLEKGTAIVNGGVIKNSTGINGGAVYISGGDFIINSGSILNNTASNLGGGIYVENGNVTIGILDDYLEHSHPVINGNVAFADGGGIAVYGGEVIINCGIVLDNSATHNQASNTMIQDGGLVSIVGDNVTLGVGVLITSNGVFNDERNNIYTIIYHAIYNDVDVSFNVLIEDSSTYRLAKEETIENDLFSRTSESLYLVGWSVDANVTEGYMIAGSKFNVTNSIDLYAVWDTTPINQYIITIPDTLTISTNNLGTIEIESSLYNFDPTSMLDVKINSNNNFKLLLDEDNAVDYVAFRDEYIFSQNDIVANFSVYDQAKKAFNVKVVGIPRFPGYYRDKITFNVEYVES